MMAGLDGTGRATGAGRLLATEEIAGHGRSRDRGIAGAGTTPGGQVISDEDEQIRGGTSRRSRMSPCSRRTSRSRTRTTSGRADGRQRRRTAGAAVAVAGARRRRGRGGGDGRARRQEAGAGGGGCCEKRRGANLLL
jgi:hypothetical protein